MRLELGIPTVVPGVLLKLYPNLLIHFPMCHRHIKRQLEIFEFIHRITGESVVEHTNG
ncbi:hypothetical protein D3C86_1935870 [compost metagenome]